MLLTLIVNVDGARQTYTPLFKTVRQQRLKKKKLEEKMN
jgi:hypothetical protein